MAIAQRTLVQKGLGPLSATEEPRGFNCAQGRFIKAWARMSEALKSRLKDTLILTND